MKDLVDQSAAKVFEEEEKQKLIEEELSNLCEDFQQVIYLFIY
jgi:hypothetical protein